MQFDFDTILPATLPAPSARWSGFPAYNFVGGHNDANSIPVNDLLQAAKDALTREGRSLATYFLDSGPQGYLPLRNFICDKLKTRAGMNIDADDVLVVSGSLQALDLVNSALLEAGDTVIIEQHTYGGALTRLERMGVNVVSVDLDDDGIDNNHLDTVLADLKSRNIQAKYIYTIPSVQNPTGTVMSKARRLQILETAEKYDVAIFEDDCYADLIWDGDRPPAFHALDTTGRVIYCGSFSKSIAPALRVGYLVADWAVMSRILSLKTDAGSGALEQMVLAEYAASHFDDHVDTLAQTLKGKCDAIVAALEEQFGASAEFSRPKGGIFIWVSLPDTVDTDVLAAVAGAEGVAINPGSEWSTVAEDGRHKFRLCFGNPDAETIHAGVTKLAEICHREFGIPAHAANVKRD